MSQHTIFYNSDKIKLLLLFIVSFFSSPAFAQQTTQVDLETA